MMDSASLLGTVESMERQPIFLLEPISCLTNWWLYLSDPLPSFGFVMPSALRFFFIIGQLEEFSNKSCRNTTWKAFINVSVGLCMTFSHNEAFLMAFPVKYSNQHLSDIAFSECIGWANISEAWMIVDIIFPCFNSAGCTCTKWKQLQSVIQFAPFHVIKIIHFLSKTIRLSSFTA